MIRLVLTFTVSLICLAELSRSINVQLLPVRLLKNPGQSSALSCRCDDPSYTYMFWYQQPEGEGRLKLIGTLYRQNLTPGDLFSDRFKISGDATKTGMLEISNLTSEDVAVYFCAMSKTGNLGQAYFGDGTKLTVLEPGVNITRPKVKVLPPSNWEGCEKKKANRTLVCVATGFYPDHITVSWKLNGVKVTSGVRTDDTALRNEDNRFYSITSRLRVSNRKWFDTRSTFTCLTSFYDGSDYQEDKDSIKGVNGGGMDREYLLKSGLTAKLSYSVFIAKSFLYGLFISAVVWKIRSSVAKRYD